MDDKLTIQKHYHDFGYAHLRSFVDPLNCQRLISRMRELAYKRCQKNRDQYFQAGHAAQTKDAYFLASHNEIAFFFDKNAHKAKSNFYALNKVGHALHNLCPVYENFSHQEKFYQLALALGIKKPLLVQSMFIFKQSKFGDEVPAHQDATFIYTEPNSVVGLWFALEDATEENGCLWVLPKGHRGKLKNRFVKSAGGLSFDFHQEVDWPRKKFLSLPAKAGDVIVLHGLLPHFSEQNRSPKTRFAYTLHFIDQCCHYPKTNWLDISSHHKRY